MAEGSVVPLSGTTRRVSHYVAKRIDILNEAKGISCRLAPRRTTIEAPSKGVLQLAKEIRLWAFEVGGLGTTTLPGISQSCDNPLMRGPK